VELPPIEEVVAQRLMEAEPSEMKKALAFERDLQDLMAKVRFEREE